MMYKVMYNFIKKLDKNKLNKKYHCIEFAFSK